MTKVFIVLTALLTVVMSVFFIATAAQWDNWRSLAQKYQLYRDAAVTERMNEQAGTQMALSIKNDAIAELERSKGDLERRIQELMDKNAQLGSDMARVEQEKLSNEAARTKVEQMLAVVVNERARLQEHNNDMRTDMIDLRTRNNALNQRSLDLTNDVNILNDEVRNLQEKNYAYEQRIAQLQRGASGGVLGADEAIAGAARAVLPEVAGRVEGTVTSVDGNYVSLSAGEAAGVQPGMQFMLVRDGNYVGDLVIETVRPRESGGKIVLVAEGREVRPGDRATTTSRLPG
jgi:hypothetical protein